MIYRLTYCNKDGVEARVDIQKGLATPVIEVEGTERPFILSYNNDKANKSGMFLSSSADIEIYETTDLDLDLNFNIDNLKTSNETELSVTHYINNVISWKGFIIPDFFSIEVRNNPVITMTASDRLGTLKNVTLSDLPSMISLRELAILCLDKTGLSLPLRTMADFNNGTGINDFFNSKILTQRLSDTKGRSISCYDILSSILTASNSFLVQRSGGWHIINKIQHEAGSGKLYTGATSFINWSDVIFNFSDINVGGRRTIIPVASTVGVFHEFGGGRMHPENYDFSLDLTGWTPVGGFVATIDNRSVDTFTTGGSGGAIISPVYGDATEKKYLVNNNEYVRNVNPIYLESDPIPIFYKGPGAVNISLDINAVGPSTSSAYIRAAIIATNGTDTKILDYSGNFIDYPDVNPPVFTAQFNDELAIAPTILKALSNGLAVSGKLEVEDDLSLYSLKIRLYGGGGGRYVLINSASVIVKSGANDNAKGTLYKTERVDNFTKAHDIDTSLFADYITTGLNGYFYRYAIDDTSSLYNSNNELTSKWTAYNDPEQLPLLQHVTRQKSRLFSVAHDLLSAELEVNNFDPLAIFVACEKRYTVVSAQFDFFKSNLSVELEEVAFQNATVRDFIYSYFGDGESGIKSIGGISGGGGGGGTGGGLTPEQLEILSFWKKDPDRENTIFTEMNAYSKLELSAYGVGDGGGGGGSDYERLDTWASYDSSKAGWVLSAFLGNDLNTRVTAIDGRVTDLENSAGSGSVTSVGITVPTGLSVSNSPVTSSGVIEIGLQTGYSIPTTVKQGQWDTAYTNNHTHSNKTVLDGITSALVGNWNTAYNNSHTHANKTVLDGITSALVDNWNTAYNNRHTHSNKAQLDLITQSNIDVLAKLSIVNGNLQIDGNAYATGELSAYGAGDGGGGGGGIIETVYGYNNLGQTFNNNILTDTFNAYTINQINTRLSSVESGSATSINTTGTGNAITSISKAGTVITANKDLTFSLSNHLHTGVYEPVFTKNSAFNKNFGTASGTVAEGNDSRIINGQTAFGWGNHSGLYLPLSGGTMTNTNLVTNLNADLLDGYHSTRFALQGAPALSTDFLVWNGATLFGLRQWNPTTPNYPEAYGTALDFKDVSTWYHRLAFGTSGRIRYYSGINTTTLTKRGDLAFTTDNVASATKLETPRTIAGVSFDGTANIAIPFANLSSKPTTLGGYGITDAVTLNTAQTIIGSKIFTPKIDVDSSSYASYVSYRLSGITRGETGYATNHGGVFLRNNTANVNLVIRDDGKIVAGGDITAPTFAASISVTTPKIDVDSSSTASYVTYRLNGITRGETGYATNHGGAFIRNNTANVNLVIRDDGKIVAGGDITAPTFAASISVTTPKVIFNAAGWSMEQVGDELQMKHNNVLKMRFTSTGSIVATEEITAFG